jgi:hypothetical protein
MKYIQLGSIPLIANIDPENTNVVSLFEATEHTFLDGIETLKKFEHNQLSSLAEYTDQIFKNRYAEFAIGAVPSLTMAVLRDGEEVMNFVIAPPRWMLMCDDEPYHQFGSIVFCISQVVDCYNGLMNDPNLIKRAKAFEVEYLRIIASRLSLNEYQHSLLLEFPNGIEHSLIYKRKPVELLN